MDRSSGWPRSLLSVVNKPFRALLGKERLWPCKPLCSEMKQSVPVFTGFVRALCAVCSLSLGSREASCGPDGYVLLLPGCSAAEPSHSTHRDATQLALTHPSAAATVFGHPELSCLLCLGPV